MVRARRIAGDGRRIRGRRRGCGSASAPAGAPRTSRHRDARLRRRPIGSVTEKKVPGLRDGDADARAPVPRRRRATAAASSSRSTARRATRRAATGSTTSTGSRRRRARPRPPSTRATGSGGTCTTGAPPTRSRPSSARSRSRSCTASAASGCPTDVECATDVGAACKQVSTALDAVGVPVATQLLGTGSGTDSLGVRRRHLARHRGDARRSLLEQGPAASGVYARFAGRAAARSQLLDPAGDVVRDAGRRRRPDRRHRTGLVDADVADHRHRSSRRRPRRPRR